jgi:hypothetical protein
MPKRLDKMREATRRLHYSIWTEDAYVQWTKRFILFYCKRHPLEIGEAEVIAFLTHVAVQRDVTASTQNQAQSALLYLCKAALGRPLACLDNQVVRAKTSERLTTDLSREETRAVLAQFDGTAWLAPSPLHTSGLWLRERRDSGSRTSTTSAISSATARRGKIGASSCRPR